MTVMTYNSLVSDIELYLNRADPDIIAMIPVFIGLGENRISREAISIGIESYVVSAFIPGQSVYAKPSLWRRSLSINYGTGTGNNTRNQVYLRSYEFCRAYAPDSTVTAPPVYYCDYGYNEFLFAPTPDAAYPFELAYMQLPDPLSAANQTNFLTNFAQDLLLYACLVEAIPFLKNDERIPVFLSMYDRALASFNAQDDLRKDDRASERKSD